MQIDLKNRVALVTGGRQGLGHNIVENFLQEGASVVTCGRDEASLRPVIDGWQTTYGNRVIGLQADVSTQEGVELLLESASTEFGGLDILVNNAATTQSGNLASLSDEQWRGEIDVKLMSMVRTARLAVPLMKQRGGGSIININAIFAKQPDVGFYATSVIRASCLSLTKLIAKEYAPDNVRANAIGLGLVATEAWRAWYDPTQGQSYDEFLQQNADYFKIPMGRLANPQEITDVVTFLASDKASYLTGTQVDIDGGLASYL
ncbi:MAG: SDR family oxidoreductase [Gammaproteobacteria bacterium]|nr:SDR family oxidoreductase [Gammaproteobacteria bacterium]